MEMDCFNANFELKKTNFFARKKSTRIHLENFKAKKGLNWFWWEKTDQWSHLLSRDRDRQLRNNEYTCVFICLFVLNQLIRIYGHKFFKY